MSRGSIVSSTKKLDESTATQCARPSCQRRADHAGSLSDPVGFVAVGEQRGSTLHVGVYEGFDRGGGIVGDHGEANAAGTRVEIFGVLASRFGLVCVALDDFDSPDDEDFAGVSDQDASTFPPACIDIEIVPAALRA